MSGQYWLESEPLSIFKYPCSGIHCGGLGEIMPGGTILWAGEATPGTIARWDIPQFSTNELFESLWHLSWTFLPKIWDIPTHRQASVCTSFLLCFPAEVCRSFVCSSLCCWFDVCVYIYIFMFSFQKITCFNNVQDLNVKPFFDTVKCGRYRMQLANRQNQMWKHDCW